MTDLDIDPELEARLRRTMRVVADGTPIDTTPWGRVVREHEPRQTVRLAGAAAAVLLVGASAVGLWRVATRPEAVDTSSPVAPQGEEYPIERIPEPVLPRVAALAHNKSSNGLVADGSSFKYWTTADVAVAFAYRSINVQGDHVVELSCIGQQESDGGAGYLCTPTIETRARPNVESTWDPSNGPAGSGFWRWANVPATTDFVQYRLGSLVLWQRPLDGEVIFPSNMGNPVSVVATAYRADGAVLQVVSAQMPVVDFEAAHPELYQQSRLSEAEQVDALSGVQQQLMACLSGNGIMISGDAGAPVLATPPAGQDIEPAWQACITEAQHWLDAYVAEHT